MMNQIFLLQAYGGYENGFHVTGGSAPMGIGIGYWALMIGSMLASWAVSSTLKRRFREHSEEPIALTGAEVATQMLRDNGILDVQVISVPGQLTDHYDPTSRTVNLSEAVYGEANIAAAAVAAHECGHAVQHKEAYEWLAFRSKMVPAVNFASKGMNVIMLMSMFGMFLFQSPKLLFVYVALFAVTTLFSIVTLPVEFDASRRALAWIDRSTFVNSDQKRRAANALHWAAMTYVVAALASLAQLLYYVYLLLGQRRND